MNVLIGIQARSSSARLPGKSLELIDSFSMTEHVVRAAQFCLSYMNRAAKVSGVEGHLVLLVPEGDRLVGAIKGCDIIEGPEDDVLARYELAYKKYFPDYMVRITGDCPLIPGSIISKHIRCATENGFDYVSNVWSDLRSYVDGYDCEVISKRALMWLFEEAKTATHKEHVTLALRENTPAWMKVASIMGYVDLSDLKYSVDTKEELDRVRQNKEGLNNKIELARQRGHNVFRF